MEVVNDLENEKEQESNFEKLNSIYGANSKVTVNGDTFRIELDSRREQIPFETLREMMPDSIYQVLSSMDQEAIQRRCVIDEALMRAAFHNDNFDEVETSQSMMDKLDGYETKQMERGDEEVVKRKRTCGVEEEGVCRDCQI